MKLPAKVQRRGLRQVSVELNETESRRVELLRAERGLRSWGAAIRLLINEAVLPTKR